MSSEITMLTERLGRLEARQDDEGAKTLAALRELRELVVSSFRAYGDSHAHLAEELAKLARRVTERLPPRRRKRR